jgi:hypothetical protein
MIDIAKQFQLLKLLGFTEYTSKMITGQFYQLSTLIIKKLIPPMHFEKKLQCPALNQVPS